MSARIPDFVDPWRLAERAKSVSGEIELARLSRLAEVLMDRAGKASFEVLFERDSQGRPRITGFVRAVLRLECQRCLELMEYLIDARLELAVIESESELGLLPQECEPVLAEEGRIHFLDLLEDELLLSLPQIAHHDPGLCRSESVQRLDTFPAQEGGNDENRANPFAVLASLKSDKQN